MLLKKKIDILLFLIFFHQSLARSVLSPICSTTSIQHFQPQQVHLALAADDHSFTVTWVTYSPTDSFVEFGTEPVALDLKSQGEQSVFRYGDRKKKKQYVHRANIGPLKPSTMYFYRVGGNFGWSDLLWFRSLPSTEDTDWSPRLAIYGDLGSENAQSLPRLQRETQSEMYDMIIHVGDFAYDLDTGDGCVGDEFLRQIEPIAAYVPYMTCPGNHEQKSNFSHYKNRFTMPERTGKFSEVGFDMFYSFNVGPIHFISINTEYYYFMEFGFHQIIRQYLWLENDLKVASSTENRSKRPWIVLFGHRPMYCSDQDKDDCTNFGARTRIGVPLLHIFGLEDLLMRYKVDLAIWAHEHDWERFWPVFDWKVFNGSSQDPYLDPKAPVHIITGSAGNRERHDAWLPLPEVTAFRAMDYGYTRLIANNKTHLQIEQVSDDQEGKVIDRFWIINHRHEFKYEEEL